MQIIETLKEIAQAAVRKTAVTLPSENVKDYSSRLVTGFRDMYSVGSGSLEDTAGFDNGNPLQQLTELSKQNLSYVYKHCAADIRRFAQTYGEEKAVELITYAQAICKVGNLGLTHDISFPGSNASESITVSEKLASINSTKSLKPPHYINKNDKDTMVCFAPNPKGDKPALDNGFLIEVMPSEMLRKSCGIIQAKDNQILIVGGNHLEAAWLLATISEAMANYNLNRDDIESGVKLASYMACGEIKVPGVTKLVGHHYIEGESIEEIKPVRVQKKPAPQKRDPLVSDQSSREL